MKWGLRTSTSPASPSSGSRTVEEGTSPRRTAYGRFLAIQSGEIARDPLFHHALAASAGRSIVTAEKLQHLFLLIRDELGALASQHIVEFGAFQGGSALFMAYLLKQLYPSATLFALDTFEGMPPADPRYDAHIRGQFSNADLPGFQSRAVDLGLTNITIVPGMIQDTFPAIAQERFGLAHIDVDIYSSVQYAQAAAWDALAPGGWLVYDDANEGSCLGATRAAEEFVMDRRVHSEQVWPHWIFRKA